VTVFLVYRGPHRPHLDHLRHVECILVLSTLILLTPFHFFFDNDHSVHLFGRSLAVPCTSFYHPRSPTNFIDFLDRFSHTFSPVNSSSSLGLAALYTSHPLAFSIIRYARSSSCITAGSFPNPLNIDYSSVRRLNPLAKCVTSL